MGPAVFTGLFVVLLLWYLMTRQTSVEGRVHQIVNDKEAKASGKRAKAEGGREGLLARGLQKIEQAIVEADVPLKPGEYVVLQLLVSGIPALLLVIVGEGVLVVTWIAISMLVPLLLLKRAKSKRFASFEQQLGEALGTMSNALRAGFGLQQAMETVSKEASPPMGTEMSRVLRETSLGASIEEALNHMVERIRSRELELMVTAVAIQRQVGGNLGEILDRIAYTIKERARIRGEIKTLTAQGRISGLIIGALPFALAALLAVINPKYLGQLFIHSAGLAMVGLGLMLEFIGIILIRKIVNIDI